MTCGSVPTNRPAGWNLLRSQTSLIPGQSDHLPRFEIAACNPSSVPLSVQKRSQAGTEFAPARRWPGDRAERMSSEGRAVQGMEARTLWPSLSRLPKMTFGVKPVPQILPALLIERRRVPAVIPAAVVHASIPSFTHPGTGMVLMWPPLPTRSAIDDSRDLQNLWTNLRGRIKGVGRK